MKKQQTQKTKAEFPSKNKFFGSIKSHINKTFTEPKAEGINISERSLNDLPIGNLITKNTKVTQ